MQYDNIGNFIRNKRHEFDKSMSLNTFAINNDIEPAVLSRIENCKQGIKLEVLAKIANGFGLYASELLSEYESSANLK